jgi:hypothetical protein
MAQHDDQALLESVRTHRERLGGAFLHGSLGTRRAVRSLTKRLVAGVVIAAVASAACVGVGFVTGILAQQAATKAASTTSTTTIPAATNTSVTEEGR